MAFDNNIVLVGNVTRDPELRFTQGGAAGAISVSHGISDLTKGKIKLISLTFRAGATWLKMWLSLLRRACES